MEPIKTRNTFAAVVRSIRPGLAELNKLEGADKLANMSRILADVDRVVLTLDSGADFAEREMKAARWDDLVDAVDAMRDEYQGRTTADLLADQRARERAAMRTVQARGDLARIAKATERADLVSKVATDPNVTTVKVLTERVRGARTAPAPTGTAKAKRAAKVVR